MEKAPGFARGISIVTPHPILSPKAREVFSGDSPPHPTTFSRSFTSSSTDP